MDKELKDKWVAALRSGKYVQGMNAIRRGNNFCCLGVLCDVIDPDGWDYILDNEDPTHPYKDSIGDDLIDEDMAKKIGLKYDEQGILSDMNDSGVSFEAIAQYIEENIEGK